MPAHPIPGSFRFVLGVEDFVDIIGVVLTHEGLLLIHFLVPQSLLQVQLCIENCFSLAILVPQHLDFIGQLLSLFHSGGCEVLVVLFEMVFEVLLAQDLYEVPFLFDIESLVRLDSPLVVEDGGARLGVDALLFRLQVVQVYHAIIYFLIIL